MKAKLEGWRRDGFLIGVFEGRGLEDWGDKYFGPVDPKAVPSPGQLFLGSPTRPKVVFVMATDKIEEVLTS